MYIGSFFFYNIKNKQKMLNENLTKYSFIEYKYIEKNFKQIEESFSRIRNRAFYCREDSTMASYYYLLLLSPKYM